MLDFEHKHRCDLQSGRTMTPRILTVGQEWDKGGTKFRSNREMFQLETPPLASVIKPTNTSTEMIDFAHNHRCDPCNSVWEDHAVTGDGKPVAPMELAEAVEIACVRLMLDWEAWTFHRVPNACDDNGSKQ